MTSPADQIKNAVYSLKYNQELKQNIVNKLLDLINTHTDNVSDYIVENPLDIIDKQLLSIGTISGTDLTIDIPPVYIKINLTNLVRSAIDKKMPSIIELLIETTADLFTIEPEIMYMCTKTRQYDLLRKLIIKNIPVYSNKYSCINQLAADGELSIINTIISKYGLHDNPTITNNVCIQAMLNNRLSIIEHFLTPKVFASVPDLMFAYFLKCIEYNVDIAIIEYFVKHGIDIRQSNFSAVRLAVSHKRAQIVRYFYHINNSVIDLLNSDQVYKFGLSNIVGKNQIIDGICKISHDNIEIGDKYYQCNCKSPHYFKKLLWEKCLEKWIGWKCPHCMSKIESIVYINQ